MTLTMRAARLGHPAMTMPMALKRELGELATAALMYPIGGTELGRRALCRPPTRRAAGIGPRRPPVVLVHGYGGNRSNWLPLERRLSREGFVDVHAHTYNVLSTSIPDIARALTARCHAAADEAGAAQVVVLGHSLGGVVLRCAVERFGLASRVSTAVTVATPHRGTRVALWGPGQVAASLRPGSPLLNSLRRGTGDGDLRWVAYWSDCDLVVPPDSARLATDVPGARDVPVPGVGHLGILRAPAFLDSVVALLRSSDRPLSVPTRIGRQPAAQRAA